MRTHSLLLVAAIWGSVWFPLNALAAEQDLAVFCRGVSNAAIEAGRLRDSGATAQAAAQTLQGKFSIEEAQAGVNTAFSYRQLKEFALFDLSSNYCTRMLSAHGNPSDSDKLWVRTHYERATECTLQGQFERESYQRCWEAQRQRDARGAEKVILSVMSLEYILAEKRACEARFPKYESQNRQAFGASVLSRISAEAMIDTYAGIGVKQGLLTGLSDLREKASAPYASMDAREFEQRCAKFPQTPELRSSK